MEIRARVILRKNEDKRLLAGHLWVFSNEISLTEGSAANGDLVEVFGFNGHYLGTGFYNLNSLIAVRILFKDRTTSVFDLLRTRILAADRRRVELGFSGTYRMVFGESDMLPGLVIDRYDNCFVIESYSAGIDQLISPLTDIADAEFHP